MKMPAGYQSIPDGFPDLLILAPTGKWATLEVKADPKSPYRPLQPQWIAKLDAMGYSSRVDPTTWPSIQVELDALIL